MPAKRHVSSPIDLYVGRRVRLWRLELGISQEDLGTQLHVSHRTIQNYEKGEDRLGASRLEKIARALEVQAASFFEGLAALGTKEASLRPCLWI